MLYFHDLDALPEEDQALVNKANGPQMEPYEVDELKEQAITDRAREMLQRISSHKYHMEELRCGMV